MMFCPDCGSLLKTKQKRGKNVMYCDCGFTSKKLDKSEIHEKVKHKEDGDIEIVDDEVEAYPVIKAKCKKCGNDKAYFWTVQTRAGDEPETKFYKCTNCKHTWRDYD